MSGRSKFSFHNFYARWVVPVIGHEGDNTVTLTTGRVHMIPLQVMFLLSVDRVGLLNYRGTVAGNMRVGIYEDNGGTPQGGDLVVESASIAKNGTWRSQEFTIASTQLIPGLYWVGIQSDEATTIVYHSDGFGTVPISLQPYRYARDGGYGAFTDPCPAVTADSQAPVLYLRVASIP